MNKLGLTVFIALLLVGATRANSNTCRAIDNDCVATEGLSAEEIEDVELAEFEELVPDTELMNDRWYKQVNVRTNVYDAPNGNVVRVIEPGFNFVTALESTSDGWTRINENEWIRTEFTSDVNGRLSAFTGFLLPEEMPTEYTVAWSLVNMYPSPEPGAEPSEQFDFIYRYTVLNLYASVTINNERWYQIASDQWVHQFRVSKVQPLTEIPEGVTTERWVSIDLYEQNLVAYEGTTPVFSTLIASGLPRWPTYEGLFNIYYRNPREYMSWGTVGDDFYSLEEVPWTMFFDEGRALHGAYWHDGFGYRRSHGCVNMSITDAKWLYDWVADYMGTKRSSDVEVGPAVYVYSSGTYDN
jgi:lipoprotein-anchoring transpeptidase ErfK/SrfK